VKSKVFLQAKQGLRLVLVSCALAAFLMTLPLSAWAHDAFFSTEFSGFEPQSLGHQDEDPFKGWIHLTVTNRGNQSWGDFHFQIFGATGVKFLGGGDFGPYWSGNPGALSYQIGADGSVIDLFFYGDPVYFGEQVSFHVYTDNSQHESFFGVAFNPTPVPIPGAVWLLGSGLVGLVGLRGKLGKA